MLANVSIVLFLLLLNGFFAMAELAIVSARRVRLRQWAGEERRGAEQALALAEDPSSFLAIVQIGITLNSVLAGAFSGATLAGPFGVYLNDFLWLFPYGEVAALGLTVAGVTYINLIVGELLPKRIGLAYAENIALGVAPVMSFLASVAAPVVWALRGSTDILLKLLRLDNPRFAPVTEDEVKTLIAEGTESGVFKPAERAMLEGVMRLADRNVRTIMTPRIDVVWLNIDDTPQNHEKIMHDSGYSRFIVAKGDLEEVLGIAHAKDLLNAVFEGRTLNLKAVMRPPLIVPDTTPVLRLLDQFKQAGQHLAIIVDEYGSIEGLVSVTDILEAIIGSLPEPGQDEITPHVQREDGSWLIDGMTPIDEVENLMRLKNMRDGADFHTLAGFIIDQMGHIPLTGDHFQWRDTRFEVMDMDGRRVDKVLIYPPQAQEEEASVNQS